MKMADIKYELYCKQNLQDGLIKFEKDAKQ